MSATRDGSYLAGLSPITVPDGVGCPDCTATVRANEMAHDFSCPVSRGIDDACDQDRDWLAARPGAPYRVRPMSRAEIVDLHLVGLAPSGDPTGWRVVVHRIGDGLRAREFLAPGAGRSAYIAGAIAELRAGAL